MIKFKVGMKVVRIIPWCTKNPDWKGTPIHKGEVHVIRRLQVDQSNGKLGLLFEDIVNPRTPSGRFEYSYNADEFEPVIESTTGFVEMAYTKII